MLQEDTDDDGTGDEGVEDRRLRNVSERSYSYYRLHRKEEIANRRAKPVEDKNNNTYILCQLEQRLMELLVQRVSNF